MRQHPLPCSPEPSWQRSWTRRPSLRSSSPEPPWQQPVPWRRPASWQPSSSGPSRPRRLRSSQPLVDLLNLDEVSDGADVAARLRVIGTDDRVADPLETERTQRVALVLLLTHLGLDLCDLEALGHQAPAFCAAAAAAFASLRMMMSGTTAS